MSDDIVAVTRIHARVIFVSQGKLEIAFCDDGEQLYTHLVLDKDDFIFNESCLLTAGDNVFIATRRKGMIYRSQDFGDTWEIVEAGIFLGDKHGYRFMSESAGWIFAVAENGSIYSKDNGDTWDYLKNPFENSIEALEFAGGGL